MFHTIIAKAIQGMCFQLSLCTAIFCVSALFLQKTIYDGYALFCTGIAKAVLRLDLAILVAAYALNRFFPWLPSLAGDILLILVTLYGLDRCFVSIRNCAGTILAMHRLYCRLERYASDHRQEMTAEKYQRMLDNLRQDEGFRVHPRYQAYFEGQAAELAEQLGLQRGDGH